MAGCVVHYEHPDVGCYNAQLVKHDPDLRGTRFPHDVTCKPCLARIERHRVTHGQDPEARRYFGGPK